VVDISSLDEFPLQTLGSKEIVAYTKLRTGGLAILDKVDGGTEARERSQKTPSHSCDRICIGIPNQNWWICQPDFSTAILIPSSIWSPFQSQIPTAN
jgi:hypothetical protein